MQTPLQSPSRMRTSQLLDKKNSKCGESSAVEIRAKVRHQNCKNYKSLPAPVLLMRQGCSHSAHLFCLLAHVPICSSQPHPDTCRPSNSASWINKKEDKWHLRHRSLRAPAWSHRLVLNLNTSLDTCNHLFSYSTAPKVHSVTWIYHHVKFLCFGLF